MKGDHFTIQEANKFIKRIKNNKATGCDSIRAEAWNMLVIIEERVEIFTKLFHKIKNKR